MTRDYRVLYALHQLTWNVGDKQRIRSIRVLLDKQYHRRRQCNCQKSRIDDDVGHYFDKLSLEVDLEKKNCDGGISVKKIIYFY